LGSPGERTHTSSSSPGAGRRLPGHYLGTVTNVNDPRKLNRVRVRVPDAGGQLELAWARVAVPFAGPGVGTLLVPPVGARVIVAFEANDQNRPIVVGAGWDQVGEASNAPEAARGEADPVRNGPRGQDTAVGAGGVSLTEPVDPYAAVYPKNLVIKTSSGHLIEYDDSEGAERISITHGTSKSWLEFHPDGSVVLGCKKKLYELTEGDRQEHTKGAHDVKVDGNSTYSTKDHRLSVEKLTAKSVKTMLFEALGEIKMTSSKQINAEAPLVKLGPGVTQANMLTEATHPLDYITGIKINGTPTVQGG
jgi:type VI secretion system (T6SS) baseplate-like injector VgrG